MKLCIIPYADKPTIETTDIFFISPEDREKYLRLSIVNSALVLVGSFEIGEDLELKINEVKFIYRHDAAGTRYYIKDATCIYNIRSVFEKQEAARRALLEAERQALQEEQRKQERLQAALRKIEEEEAQRLKEEAAKLILYDESAGTEEKLRAVAFLEQKA